MEVFNFSFMLQPLYPEEIPSPQGQIQNRNLTAFSRKIYSVEWAINLCRSHRFEMSR
jgi:hypothetical protein